MCGEALSPKHRVSVESVTIFSNFAAQAVISDTQMTQKQPNAVLLSSAFVFSQVPMPASRSMSDKPTHHCFLNPFMMLCTRRILRAVVRPFAPISYRISLLCVPYFRASALERAAGALALGYVSMNGGGGLSFME